MMKELAQIISAWRQQPREGRGALATVVHVAGSSYRREGARMLILENGTWIGGISGGCLEGDALKQAQKVLFRGQPRLVEYNTLDDDPFQIGASLGCKGRIEVLIEPMDFSSQNVALVLLADVLGAHRPAVAFLAIDAGECSGHVGVAFDNGSLRLLPGSFEEDVLRQEARRIFEAGGSRIIEVKDRQGRPRRVFAELMLPAIHLVVFGTHYDVVPLLEIGKVLGWRMTAVGKRTFLPAEVFHLAEVRDNVPEFTTPARTAVVLMSHDFATDKANLRKMLQTPVSYIGMLGPKVRRQRMLDELTREGLDLRSFHIERLHNPVGLDIGASTPETIALSIAAEIQAHFGGRSGGALRERQGPIYERSPQG